MNVLCRGDVLQDNLHVFQSIASLDENNRLLVTFEGVLRVDNPYRYLYRYLEDLERLLPQQPITLATLDFVRCKFSNDNCFYVLMDIIDKVYLLLPCPVVVRRIIGDDWQTECLPMLLNLSENEYAQRTSFEDVQIQQPPQ